MGHTMSEKLLADHAHLDEVWPGQFIRADVDLVMGNDLSASLAAREFPRLGLDKVWRQEAIVLVQSHFVPAKDVAAAENARMMRWFAQEQGIVGHYEIGRGGIEHALLPEEGWIYPGQLVVGGDSHTPTYGALNAFAVGIGATDMAVALATGRTWLKVPETIRVIFHGRRQPWVEGKDLILKLLSVIGVERANYQTIEFAGPALAEVPMEGRFAMANMTAEAQAKTGMFEIDDVARDYLRRRVKDRDWKAYASDPDAAYSEVVEIDVGTLEPMVAYPFSPANGHPLAEAEGIAATQVFIGSCTNGWLSDMRTAARIMRGKQVHPDVRCIVIPATQKIYKQALREGLIEIFAEAGCVVAAGTCGPCLGGYYGILDAEDVCISTSNRNFHGRMGHYDGQVYLTNPAVAAATAITGKITHPDRVLEGVAV